MIAALLGLLAATAAPQPCSATLCQPEALAPFAAQLANPPRDRPLHILQLGDSHTAGDAITRAWRDDWQARLGNGGRGMLPPGRPYPGYRARGLGVSVSSGWTMKGVFGAVSALPRPPIGLSGYTLVSNTAGATLGLVADAGQEFDALVLCAVAGPAGGKIAVTLGPVVETIDLVADADTPRCRRFTAPDRQTQAAIRVLNGQARITSWGVERRGAGIMLSNLGVPGAQLVHFARSDDAVIAEELRAWAPDLIVIAFGTNEGFAPRVDGDSVAAVLRQQVERLRRLAGPVPMLIIGAPDALTRNTVLQDNADGLAPDCNSFIDNAPAFQVALPTLIALDIADAAPLPPPLVPGFALVDLPPSPASTAIEPQPRPQVGTGRPLFAPPGLALVRAAQRGVAAEMGLAFWDWQARMGGTCAAVGNVQATPRLMAGDFIHYTSAGGAEVARRLRIDLAHGGVVAGAAAGVAPR